MLAYLAGQDVTLTIPLVTSDGTAIEASAVEYRVINQAETELIAKIALPGFVAADPEAQVTIPGGSNALGAGELRSLRIVELYVTTAAGVVRIDTEYMVEANIVLTEGINSFQSYPAALMLAYETPNLDAWNDAGKAERVNALIAARRNIGKLALRYVTDESITEGTRHVANSSITTGAQGDVTTLTQAQYATLPTEFKEALARAQVLEADFLLNGGDEADDLRRKGIMSMTVGESSQFFRTTMPLEGPVCKRAARELSRYILSVKRIGRG